MVDVYIDLSKEKLFHMLLSDSKVLSSPYSVTSLFPIETVHQLLDRHMQCYGDQGALIDGPSGRKYTFAQVRTTSNRIAAGLQLSVKFRKGEIVAVVLPNCPEYTLITLGCLKAGGIVSGVNPAYTEDEILRHFNDSQCCIVVTAGNYLENVIKAASQCKVGQIRRIFLIDDTPSKQAVPRDDIALDSADVLFHSSAIYKPPTFDPRVDLAFLPYSSGTTGVPKGVMLSHHSIVTQLNCGANRNLLPLSKQGGHEIAILPLFHIYGLVFSLSALNDGVVQVFMPKFIWRDFLQFIERYKVEAACIVPPMMVLFAKSAEVNEFDLRHFKAVLVGAAPLGRELSEEVLNRLPHLTTIIQGYGMTELGCASHITPFMPRDKIRHGSIGQLLPSFEGKVIDLKTGESLGPMKTGEICVRGECSMRGYWNRPDATAAIMNGDFIATGDIGYYDDEGYFYIVDRLKELIKVRGFQVPPAELEDLLLKHADIKNAAVIGVPDPAAGELPRAYVVLKEGKVLSESEVQQFVAERVAHFKQLKGGVEFVLDIPTSPSGKILRRLLKEKYIKTNKSKL